MELDQVDVERVARWASGYDVVIVPGIVADWRIVSAVRSTGAAVIVWVSPGAFDPSGWLEHRPSAVWVPTPYRWDEMVPFGASVVELPAPTDLVGPFLPRETPGPLRVVHLAGVRSSIDRAGTQVLGKALRSVTGDVEVLVRTQTAIVGAALVDDPRVTVAGPCPREDLYVDADVVVVPRRTGGLSLVAAEAMAAGCAVVMAGGDGYPALLVGTRDRGTATTALGPVELGEASAPDLAWILDGLARDADQVSDLRAVASAWAAEHGMAAGRDRIRSAIAAVARAVSAPAPIVDDVDPVDQDDEVDG